MISEELDTIKREFNSELTNLRKLGEHDAEIAKLKSFEAEIPRFLERAKEHYLEAEEEVRSFEEEIDNLKKELRTKEGEVKSFKDQMGQKRSKLVDVKTNKEYSAIQAEMKTTEEKIAENEERQLAIMESLEGIDGELKQQKEALAEEKRKFEEITKQKEQEKIRLMEAMEEEKAKKADSTDRIDPDTIKIYNSLVKSGKTDAITEYKNQACQICFARITPQEEILLSRGKDIIFCPQCGRFLYSKE